MKAPKIRFKGFEGDWQKFKIKDICINKGTGTLTKDKVASEYGYPVINGGVSNYGYYFDYNNENAITISSRGENAGYAKYNKGKFRAGGLCYVYESQKHNTQFIGILLNGKEKHIKSTMIARTTIPALNKSEFNEYFITIPEKQKEQEKIGAFFEKLDTQITQQSQKLEKLKNIKQSFLQKLFPKDGSALPELRFKGFEGDFIIKTLGDFSSVFGGNAWKSDSYDKNGEYLVVTIANVTGEKYINTEIGNKINIKLPNNYILNKNDILISLTGNVGRVSKCSNVKAVLNQRVGKLIIEGIDINNDFIFHFLRNKKFEKAMIDAGQGAAQKNISNNDITSSVISLPSLPEQEKIGAFFEKLDTQITHQSQKIQKLQNIKQSLLEKMFI